MVAPDGAMAQAARLRSEETSGAGGGFAVPGPLAKLAEYPRRWRQFLHEVRVEMRQVNWPSGLDVRSTTIVVIITVAFFGIFFFVVDRGVGYFIEKVLNYFKH
jgi:preprotein translocase subunit SecE